MDSNLRNHDYFNKSQTWEFHPFNDCFPQGIKMGDIDGSILWNNEHLITEFKYPGFTMSEGQRRMFGRLLARGNTTIFLVEGETNKPTRIRIGTTFGTSKDEVHKLETVWHQWMPCNGIDGLKKWYKSWSESAESQPSYMYDVPKHLKP